MVGRRRHAKHFGSRNKALTPQGHEKILPQVYLQGTGKPIADVYLSDTGKRRLGARLKWLVSICLAGGAGLAAIIAIVVVSQNPENKGDVFTTIRDAGNRAMAPFRPKFKSSDGFQVAAGKQAKINTTSRGLITNYIIHDRVIVRRNHRERIVIKPYARVVMNLATAQPARTAGIPPFNPFKLYANKGFRLAGRSVNDAANRQVKVNMVSLVGGILPAEDGQALSNDQVAEIVSEVVRDMQAPDEAVIADDGTVLDETESETITPVSTASDSASLAPAHTTILTKTIEQQDDSGDVAEVRNVVVAPGDSLFQILKRNGAQKWQANQIIQAMKKIFPANMLQAGEKIRILLTPSASESAQLEPIQVSVFAGDDHKVTVARSASGSYLASAKPIDYDMSKGVDKKGSYRQRATLYTSLYHAGLEDGLDPRRIMKLLRIHAFDTDFKRFVRAGDQVELFFNLENNNAAEAPRYGVLLYTGININGVFRRFYRFRTPDGKVDYYDATGKSAKKFLMRKPVRGFGVRLSSGFGYRIHPILKRRKLHTGVDWAARRGTPILAAGTGIIEAIGIKGGYGNYIRIRHANGYKTAYAHMRRFARGLKKGSKVRQGQVIGYVGTTGRSTAPHLHFEWLVNNQFVNPMKIHVPRGRTLKGKQLVAFLREKARIDDLMHRAPVKTRVSSREPEIAAALR